MPSPSSTKGDKAMLAAAFDAALRAGHPAKITSAAMAQMAQISSCPTTGPITGIIAIGKAAAAMASAVRTTKHNKDGGNVPGIMVTTDESFAQIDGMNCFASAHPVPDERSVAAANAIGEFVDGLGADDHLLLLISGGGSALMVAPPAGLTLDDKQALNHALLASGLSIHEVNAIRRLFSDLKGGRLARRAYPAKITAFLLSDVDGDRIESIASGPAAPDPVDFADACKLITDNAIDKLPFVPPFLSKLSADPSLQPVRPGDPVLGNVVHHVLASNALCQDAANAALDAASGAIDASHIDLPPLAGDVLDCAARLVDAACANAKPGTAIGVTGGETTVHLGTGPVGLGGRSQELALAFAREMKARDDAPDGWVILAGGTDGRDGPTDAAGAMIAASDEWDIEGANVALLAHDVHSFLDRRGQLLRVQPTGTNLADLVLVATRRSK